MHPTPLAESVYGIRSDPLSVFLWDRIDLTFEIKNCTKRAVFPSKARVVYRLVSSIRLLPLYPACPAMLDVG